MKPLTPKQERFVAEYLIDLNAAAAYTRAGYKARSAKVAAANAARLIAKDSIQAAIQAAGAQRAHESDLTAKYVLSNLQEVVERCMQRAPVCDRRGEHVTDEEGRGVWTFNAKSAIGALTKLGEHLNLFKQTVEHTGKDGGPIKTDAQVVFYIPETEPIEPMTPPKKDDEKAPAAE